MTRFIALALGVILYMFAMNAVMAGQIVPSATVCYATFDELDAEHGPLSFVHGEVENEHGTQLHIAHGPDGRVAFMIFGDNVPWPRFCTVWASEDRQSEPV